MSALILIVEDDPGTREALVDMLDAVGYRTVTAVDGRAALELLRGDLRPAAILLDLMMPVMDGWQFRAEQMRDPSLARIPTIVMSANPTAQAEAIDAFRRVAKPFEEERLLGAVRDAVSATESAAALKRQADAERIAALGTLAGGIAHEINNPLAFISTNLRLLEREVDRLPSLAPAELAELAVELKAMLRDSLDGAERIASIVRGIRAFSGKEQAVRPIDVAGALEIAARLAGGELKARARVIRELGPTPLVLADEGTLAQAFLHVLVNAAQSIPEGAVDRNEIRLTTRTGDGETIVSIADTGGGISAGNLPHVFEPFFTTKPVGAGTGLGLSIAHGIVRSLGGRIEIESEPGKGTTVRFFFPAARVDTRVALDPSSPRARVLLVDDEPAVVRALQRLLSARYEVAVAASAAQALARIGAEKFDVILCDLLMPEMSGMDLWETLRTLHPDLAERMIFMTGGAFTERAREFVAARPRRCVEKPFAAAELESALALVLGAGRRM